MQHSSILQHNEMYTIRCMGGNAWKDWKLQKFVYKIISRNVFYPCTEREKLLKFSKSDNTLSSRVLKDEIEDKILSLFQFRIACTYKRSCQLLDFPFIS